ncbi:MAG: polysaccharide deacetylase family protein [Planctomycetes bacterium]|nr:polysaccharide deacetylase family protein [Planctomycetota bacterium]MCB9872120.1 polysaccharide deacetylase family protein [Planctomycetota bacterium]
MQPTAEATRTVAVLAFHKIGEPPRGGWQTWNYIAEAVFCEQLAVLRDAGYAAVDVHAFRAGLRDPATLPDRCALLTFDDGYRTMLTVAEPLLARYGYPAVCFVPTDFVGGHNSWDHGNEPDEPICSWDELAELQRRGVAIQSHGASHRQVSTLDDAALQREVCASRACLEERLGTAVDLLAFPYGDDGGAARCAAVGTVLQRAGYAAAFRYKGGLQRLPSAQPFALTRVAMGPDTDLRKHLGIAR